MHQHVPSENFMGKPSFLDLRGQPGNPSNFLRTEFNKLEKDHSPVTNPVAGNTSWLVKNHTVKA